MGRTSTSNFISKMENGTFFYRNETPVGTINGSNTDFTLEETPNPTTSLEVTVNGSEMSLTEDYTLSGDTLSLIIAPPTGSILKVDYRVEPA